MQQFHQRKLHPQKQSNLTRSGDRWHWRRKSHVVIWLFLIVCLAPDLFAQPLAPERVPVSFPVQFTRNDGQWDASVRFAVLHQASQVSLRRDGIDIVPPRKRVLDLPGLEMRHETSDVVSVRYLNPSPNMRLVGADTSGTAMHFYAGGTPDSCFEHVASFGKIRYHNVWDGCDIEYAPDGAHLRERIILYPGADVSQLRMVRTGSRENLIGTAKISSSTPGAEAGLFLNTSGKIVSLRYTPGVLRDTIVLETEFRTFFGDEKGSQSSSSCRVLPDGAILLSGYGKAPYMARTHYFPPQDSTCSQSNCYYLAEFVCHGMDLRFCTSVNGGMHEDQYDFQIEMDGTSGYFLLSEYSDRTKYTAENCRLPVRTPFLDTLWTSRGAGSWLGRVSRDGILSIATHIDGIDGMKAARLNDRGILLVGHRFTSNRTVAPPFLYYTSEMTEEHPGVLLKLSANADSVLIGVNLELFGDTLFPVSTAELPDGSIVIVGITDRSPFTANAWQVSRGGMIDIYLARLTAEMDSVLWATFLGGAGDELLAGTVKQYHGWRTVYEFKRSWREPFHAIFGDRFKGSYSNDCLATDADGGIWITGTTTSPSMPELPGTGSRITRGSVDMFLARFTSEGQPTMLRAFGGETPGNSSTADPTYWDDILRDSEWALNLEILPCGRCLVTGLAWTKDFPQYETDLRNPWQRYPERWAVSTLSVYDRWGTLHYSGWYPDNISRARQYDPTGHLVSPEDVRWHEVELMAPGDNSINNGTGWSTYNALQPHYAGYGADAILTRQYLPLCGEDAVTCSFTVPDTIRHDSTRGYLSDSFIPLDVKITNPDPIRAVFDLQAELRLPPGLVLVPDTMPLLLDVAPMLAPGDTAYAQWVLQVRPDLIADTLLPITVVTHYRWADHLDNCLQSHSGCRAEIVYARRDSRRMELSCDLDAPMSLMIDATGEHYVSDTIPVTLTLRNLGQEAVLPGEVALQVHVEGEPGTAGVSLLPAGDHIHYLDRLQPNAEVQSPWIAHVDRRGFDREVTFEVVVRDEIGQLPVACLTTVHVPGIPALRCSLSAPDALYPVSGTGFEEFAMELQLENIVDTLVRRVEAEIDLTQAPHLRLSSGETARHYLGPTAAAAIRTSLWQLAVDPAPQDSSSETITVWYWYQEDSTRRSCEIRIQLIPVIQSSVCSITAPAVLSVDDSVLLPSPFTLDYRLRNTGNETLDVGRYVLSLAPSAGLLALDPLSVAGGTLAPGTAANRTWRVQAQALQSARSAVLTVEALSLQDSVLSTCMHMLNIPAIDGLRCTLTAEDTVRFVRTPPDYQPSPLNLQLDLRNVLDESHTNIEAIIDLAQAPRLTLDPSETASKSIDVIESHSTANLTWFLIPQPASTAEDQEIIVRYRSDEQAAWKQCSVIIHIEAWPEETGIACATGGHDSLYADPYYERFIPDPLFVSYTATNTGTIALTGCEASIVLPPEFVLTGSDSTQLFTSPEFMNQQGGPVSPGTLLPNASCTRWWMITPSNQLTAAGAVNVTWQWRSDQQGSGDGCSSSIEVVFDSPAGIVLSPKHLYFEAERGGPLPAAQDVLLWTGGGMTIPWTIQPSETWLNANPLSGNLEATVAVQPNSTMLEVGAHGADLLFAATPTDRHVAITYVIRKSTGIESPATPGALTLDAWPQPVAAGARLYVRIGGEAGSSCRLTLHDLLGRERFTRYAEPASPVVIDLGALQLPTGVYLLRAIAEDGAQATRMISVTGGR